MKELTKFIEWYQSLGGYNITNEVYEKLELKFKDY